MSQDGRAPDPATRTEGEGETLDMPEGYQPFTPGQVLGERYQILEMLGRGGMGEVWQRGGMGEVWQAFDLKLRVEVALKALREDFFKSERRLELLRQEVRAAREVMSPNVCRIFDLIEIEGRELVSMEYVDGATLLGVLQERGPLELKEAQDIASQFLAGLEAIHKVGLIHRDIKPENIMLTRAGRVVVMDFGLARQDTEGGGSVSGTPAYMAPEQAAGQTLDPRADVYSAGVVLAEMVSPEGIKSFESRQSESRQSVWEGVRSEPAKLPDSPWAPVLKRAVAKDREGRFNTARTLTRALEDVTLRVEGAEDLHPYPGLASFTEEDAEYFFGREAEVEQMWRKLEGTPRMLALVGPSGAGKSSFLNAGLIPGSTADWATAVCKPGTNPELALSRALAAELAGDAQAVDLLLRFDDPEVALEVVSRWRSGSAHALLIVDQFEELFTQNAYDGQERFADLLNRFVLEADVHVLFSMRDDFLFRCHKVESLKPIFFELTPIGPPVGGALRRALVRPATKCGYRFEDDELVEEMLAEVEGERGALPLLAFAAARLWEKRDRETGLLTREAYHDIGGVGGALARHAEATIDRIGTERIAIVRELFRNLVTAEGTRAVREWGELLSVFDTTDVSRAGINPAPTGKLAAAEEVLRALVDARLLTSYEVREEDEEPTRRVEIIHESLLANWPRLVRWQTQDADAAQLRDQLRQAAKTWDEQGRTDDTLWTGSAYREFASWRDRYPGGLTGTEEAFASAMTTLAGRRRRRRRMAVAAVLVIGAAVTAVTTTLWRRSVVQERRAEAQKLVAVGQLRLEDYPTAALAHATQSLELFDSREARLLALEALWEGPTAFVVNEDRTTGASFSPDGKWLVQSIDMASSLAVVSRDGTRRVLDHPTESGTTRVSHAVFGDRSDIFLSWAYFTDAGRVALWSAPEARLLASAQPMVDPDVYGRRGGIGRNTKEGRAIVAMAKDDVLTIEGLYADGRQQTLGSIRLKKPAGKEANFCIPRASGEWLGLVEGNEVSIVRIGADGLSERFQLGWHNGDLIAYCQADPSGHFLFTATRTGGIKRWDASGDVPPTIIDGPSGIAGFRISKDGSHFVAFEPTADSKLYDVWVWSTDEKELRLLRTLDDVGGNAWDFDPVGLRLAKGQFSTFFDLYFLEAPADAEPIMLRRGPAGDTYRPGFSPDTRWLATTNTGGLAMWPLVRPYPAVIHLEVADQLGGPTFGPEGRFLVTTADARIDLVPLDGPVPADGHIVYEQEGGLLTAAQFSPNGEVYGFGDHRGPVWLGRDDGEEPLPLPGAEALGSDGVCFSSDSRFVAALSGFYDIKNAVFRVWDVATAQEVAVLRLADGEFRLGESFSSDGRLLTGTSMGVVAWDVGTGDHEILVEADVRDSVASDDGRRLVVTEAKEHDIFEDPLGSPVFFDLDTGDRTTLTTHGLQVLSMALDRDGKVVVTGDRNGIIRVGSVTGEEPHLLLGHPGTIRRVAIDPLGRWIASAGSDNTVRLWPMPDLSEPPLHTLPHDELIAKLKTLTNLRVVRDEESSTGWKLTHDPFPGWETVPTW